MGTEPTGSTSTLGRSVRVYGRIGVQTGTDRSEHDGDGVGSYCKKRDHKGL